MRKILFVMFAALAFVACEKETPEIRFLESPCTPVGINQIKYSPNAILLDREKGGEVVVTGDNGSFPEKFAPRKKHDSAYSSSSTVYFWGRNIMGNFPSVEEIRNVELYEAHGCTIKLSPDFKRYTVKVDENCEWDYLEVVTRWADGHPGTSRFWIVLNPDMYDSFK